MKKFLLGLSLLAGLLLTSALPATSHAASQTFTVPVNAQTREPIGWDQGGVEGCAGVAKVAIFSLDGHIEHWTCFFLDRGGSSAYGYLGLGDPWSPGKISKAMKLISGGGAPSGWIKYYGGRFPQGTYCQFQTGQEIRFQPSVSVTQVALNVSSSYPQCPVLVSTSSLADPALWHPYNGPPPVDRPTCTTGAHKRCT